MRGGRCIWRPHLIFLKSRLDERWQQEVWPRHENESRERCDSSLHLRFFSRLGVLFFLRCRAVATVVAVDRAASWGTQRASPVNRACPPAKVMELTCRLPTCRVQVSSPCRSSRLPRRLKRRRLRRSTAYGTGLIRGISKGSGPLFHHVACSWSNHQSLSCSCTSQNAVARRREAYSRATTGLSHTGRSRSVRQALVSAVRFHFICFRLVRGVFALSNLAGHANRLLHEIRRQLSLNRTRIFAEWHLELNFSHVAEVSTPRANLRWSPSTFLTFPCLMPLGKGRTQRAALSTGREIPLLCHPSQGRGLRGIDARVLSHAHTRLARAAPQARVPSDPIAAAR